MKTKRQQALQTIHAGTIAIAVLGLQSQTVNGSQFKTVLAKSLNILNEVKAAREVLAQPTEAEDLLITQIKSRLSEAEEALW